MLGRASEEIVVIEIEVDNLAVAVYSDAGNVVSDVSIPIDSKSIRIHDHVSAVALRRLNGLDRLHLLDASRIGSERSSFVAVPKSHHQFHEQVAIDLVPLLDRVVCQFGRGRAEVDVHDLAELLAPIFGERPLIDEPGRR
jgi:hypothetical protein